MPRPPRPDDLYRFRIPTDPQLSPDGGLVEIIELPKHPWFLGCQFHPELKSRPNRAHPLFAAFIGASLQRRTAKPEPTPAQLATTGR
jgi:hypothetical protein